MGDPCVSRIVQQPLGRSPLAGAPARERPLCGFRDRHEPCRRDHAARQAGASACGGDHHGRAGSSRVLHASRGNRRRQGGNLCRRRAAARPFSIATIRTSSACVAAPSAGVEHIVSFGERYGRRASSDAQRGRDPQPPKPISRIPGRLQARRARAASRAQLLAVLAAASIVGADLALAALALADLRPAAGRGTRLKLALHGGEALVIDKLQCEPDLDARRSPCWPQAAEQARPAGRGSRRRASSAQGAGSASRSCECDQRHRH